MREAIDKLDYVGFTYNNIHSSQLGLKSVSSGNRYQKDLLPVAQDYTTDVLGGDGTYFFGAKFKNNDIKLSIAFDDVSELEMREISKWLYNNGEIGTLILDESPYIKYYVRVTSQPQIKYLTFEDSYGARVHKGEMDLTFTGYDPYGYCTEKWLSDYEDDNVGEWAEASGLLFSKKVNNVDYYDTYSAGVISLYNPGDLNTDFVLTLTVDKGTELSPINSIVVTLDSNNHFALNTTSLSTGAIIVIDTQKRLIKVGNAVKNNLLINGNLFSIPVSKTISLSITGVTTATITYPYKFL